MCTKIASLKRRHKSNQYNPVWLWPQMPAGEVFHPLSCVLVLLLSGSSFPTGVWLWLCCSFPTQVPGISLSIVLLLELGLEHPCLDCRVQRCIFPEGHEPDPAWASSRRMTSKEGCLCRAGVHTLLSQSAKLSTFAKGKLREKRAGQVGETHWVNGWTRS